MVSPTPWLKDSTIGGKVSNKISIYAMCEPDTEEVRYIGCTQDVKTRVQAHVMQALSRQKRGKHLTPVAEWLLSLHQHSLLPVVLILEEVRPEKRWEVERKWINKYRAEGARLTNVFPEPKHTKWSSLVIKKLA